MKTPEPHQLPLRKDKLMLDKLLLRMNRVYYQSHIRKKNFSSKFLFNLQHWKHMETKGESSSCYVNDVFPWIPHLQYFLIKEQICGNKDFDWLTDWLIDWLKSQCEQETITKLVWNDGTSRNCRNSPWGIYNAKTFIRYFYHDSFSSFENFCTEYRHWKYITTP